MEDRRGNIVRPFAFESIAKTIDYALSDESVLERSISYINGRFPVPAPFYSGSYEEYQECEKNGGRIVNLLNLPFRPYRDQMHYVSFAVNLVEMNRKRFLGVTSGYHHGNYIIDLEIPKKTFGKRTELEKYGKCVTNIHLGCVGENEDVIEGTYTVPFNESAEETVKMLASSAEILSFKRMLCSFIINSENIDLEKLLQTYGMTKEWFEDNGPRYLAALFAVSKDYSELRKNGRCITIHRIARTLDKALRFSRFWEEDDRKYFVDAAILSAGKIIHTMEKRDWNGQELEIENPEEKDFFIDLRIESEKILRKLTEMESSEFLEGELEKIDDLILLQNPIFNKN